MQKANRTVVNETKYMAFVIAVLSVVLQVVYIAISAWNYKVLISNIYTDIITILNFYVMGIYVSKAVEKDEKEAQKIIKLSHTVRTLGLFVAIVIGVVIPVFDLFAIIIPLFFPRLAISLRPLFKNYNVKKEGENE